MNNKRIVTIVMLVVAASLVVAGVFVPSFLARAIVLGLALSALVGVMLSVLVRVNRDKREAYVNQLRRAGFDSGIMEDDNIGIRVGETPVFAEVIETPRKGQDRVQFTACIQLDRDEISEDGLNYIASKINSNSRFVTVILDEGGLRCRVESMVTKPKEMVDELQFAVIQIERVASVVKRNYRSVVAKYPVKSKRRIGFDVGEREKAREVAA